MTRFTATPRFGVKPTASSESPRAVAKSLARRTACLAKADDALAVLPAPGESVHCLMTGYYDLMHVVARVVEKVGPCKELRLATLSYNARNLKEMLALLDSGGVKQLSLLCSVFYKNNNKKQYDEAQTEFAARGQKIAAGATHCKVACFRFASGLKWVMEGSANLRTNRSREQLTIISDNQIHDWHAAWIDDMVKGNGSKGDQGTD